MTGVQTCALPISKLAEVLSPVQGWLDKLAKRLDHESNLRYRADVNVHNPHGEQRFALDAEIEELKKAPPAWVDVGRAGKNPEMKKAPLVPDGHFDIGKNAEPPLKNAFETFHQAIPDVLPPGTVLYRIVDPRSYDNSICWMTKAEFDKLTSKSDWRRRFAVWMNWNANGEFITYTVPPGNDLPVWRGPTASQVLKDRNGIPIKADARGNLFVLEGGAEQIVVNPTDLKREHTSARQYTNWAAEGGDIDVRLVGVPELKSNWRQ